MNGAQIYIAMKGITLFRQGGHSHTLSDSKDYTYLEFLEIYEANPTA